MPRALPVLILAAAALSGATGVAHGLPPGPIPAPPPCAFVMSAPMVAGDAVTVTVESVGCGGLAVPYYSVACLQAGIGAPTRCAQGRGSDPARVTLPYQPGVVFVASGRGCAGWVNLEPAADCQLLGPTNTPL